MNTATQLLERSKEKIERCTASGQQLIHDIEAYLAKPAEKTKVWDAEGYDALCQEFFCAKQQVEQAPFYRLKGLKKPIALVKQADLEGLSKCNGTSLWAENPSIHEDNEGTVEQAGLVALYTSPQVRELLSEDEIESVWRTVEAGDFRDCVVPFGRAIEAKLNQ